jgi:MFS transporter, AAHS family, 4-hydroxybenzoate transporter
VRRTLQRMDPKIDLSGADQFILSDEEKPDRNFRVGQLFRADLRLITPMLWLGYFASSLAIYFAVSWGPIVVEELQFPRHTAALVASTGSLLGAMAGLLLMRFTDRRGPGSVAVYPAICVPVLLALGLGLVPRAQFLAVVIMSTLLISGGHFGVLSIAGIFYPSSIRASGGGWATSMAKFGAILGPIAGGAVLSSGIPILRSYALLAVCPAILCLCGLGIAAVVRARAPAAPSSAALAAVSSASGERS